MRGRGGPAGGDRASRLEGFLRSMDANGNGVLEPSEVPEERRGMLRFMAGRLGVDPEKPIPLDKVRESMERRDREDREGGHSGNSASEPKPLVPFFGEEQETSRVPEFGQRVEYASLGGSAADSALAKLDPERASRVRGFAESMLRRYDRNRSGVLEEEEWEGSRLAQGADANDDGKITRDEITLRLVEFSGRRSRDSDRGSDRRSSDASESDDSDGSGDGNGRRSYRFRTSTELLPEGLPDWFARYDVDGDGQVAMAEYSQYWSESEARKFDGLDLNRDGLITPRECLDAESSVDDSGGGPLGPGAPGAGPGPGAPPPGGAGPPSRGGGPPPPADDKPAGPSQESGGAKPWWLQ